MTGSVDIEVQAVEQRAREIRARIDAAGGSGRVRLVAVTKGFGPEAVKAALDVGLFEIGESYGQELVAKFDALGPLPDEVQIHFIGRLQTNKVKALSNRVHVFQSVDRVTLIHELARRAPGASVLVQINLSGDPAKGGCSFDAVGELVGTARDRGLDVRGLMGVGPTGPPELARPGFARLVALAEEMGLPERSIGMSGDLEVAVSEGSTMVRIGTDLFGPRVATSG